MTRLLIGLMCCGLMSHTMASDKPRDGLELLETVRSAINNINTVELQALVVKHPDLCLIDVRTPSEVATLGGTINAGHRNLVIPRGWLEFRIGNFVPKADTPIVVYCGINERSPLAAKTLRELGYTRVYNYADGFFKWRDAGLAISLTDEAPGTMLYRRPQQVSPNVWSAIGATAPPTYENSGHNNNLSFIVGDDAVLVVNAGDNALLAQALHDEIRARTDKPVKYVVLENGQGHAMLGSNYWQAHGAKIIAHKDAAHEIEGRGAEIIERMRRRNRDKAMGTELTQPDIVFEDRYSLDLGDEQVEILNLGPAHSPGDIAVWLPGQKLVMAGDMAFHQRLLPIFDETDTRGWVATWTALEALGAEIVIPGHGIPTKMSVIKEFTVDYLEFLHAEVEKLLDEGGKLEDAYSIDQSAYSHLHTFDELARRNAGQVFRELEFE